MEAITTAKTVAKFFLEIETVNYRSRNKRMAYLTYFAYAHFLKQGKLFSEKIYATRSGIKIETLGSLSSLKECDKLETSTSTLKNRVARYLREIYEEYKDYPEYIMKEIIVSEDAYIEASLSNSKLIEDHKLAETYHNYEYLKETI